MNIVHKLHFEPTQNLTFALRKLNLISKPVPLLSNYSYPFSPPFKQNHEQIFVKSSFTVFPTQSTPARRPVIPLFPTIRHTPAISPFHTIHHHTPVIPPLPYAPTHTHSPFSPTQQHAHSPFPPHTNTLTIPPTHQPYTQPTPVKPKPPRHCVTAPHLLSLRARRAWQSHHWVKF